MYPKTETTILKSKNTYEDRNFIIDEYELKAIYDPRQSFHKKARIRVYDDNTEVLVSYDTEVAYVQYSNRGIKFVSVRKLKEYSNTTIRHLREFLRQNGFNADMSKQQLIKLYVGE